MNAITVPWRPSVVQLSWCWPWTHSQQWTIWNSCCIIWSDGGSYCSAKTLVHIRRCVSPEATTDYTRPFSVTENLSRYQNVQHYVTVCTLTVASRTRTCRQQQSNSKDTLASSEPFSWTTASTERPLISVWVHVLASLLPRLNVDDFISPQLISPHRSFKAKSAWLIGGKQVLFFVDMADSSGDPEREDRPNAPSASSKVSNKHSITSIDVCSPGSSGRTFAHRWYFKTVFFFFPSASGRKGNEKKVEKVWLMWSTPKSVKHVTWNLPPGKQWDGFAGPQGCPLHTQVPWWCTVCLRCFRFRPRSLKSITRCWDMSTRALAMAIPENSDRTEKKTNV